jgi:phage FluMu protein Com
MANQTIQEALTKAGISLKCPKCGKQVELETQQLHQHTDSNLKPILDEVTHELKGFRHGPYYTVELSMKCSCGTIAQVAFCVPRDPSSDCKAADGSL